MSKKALFDELLVLMRENHSAPHLLDLMQQPDWLERVSVENLELLLEKHRTLKASLEQAEPLFEKWTAAAGCETCGTIPDMQVVATGEGESLQGDLWKMEERTLKGGDVLYRCGCGALFLREDDPSIYYIAELDKESLHRLDEPALEALLPALVSQAASDDAWFSAVLTSYVGTRADRAARVLALITLEPGDVSAGILRLAKACASIIAP